MRLRFIPIFSLPSFGPCGTSFLSRLYPILAGGSRDRKMEGHPSNCLFMYCVPNEISESSNFGIEGLASLVLTCMEFSCEENLKKHHSGP